MLLALLGASMAVAVDRKVGCFCFGLGAKGRRAARTLLLVSMDPENRDFF